MTSLLEKIIAKIAPHRCISCSNEDNILCETCTETELLRLEPACLLCGRPTVDFRVCSICAPDSGLNHLWAAGRYAGLLEKVLHMYKFDRAVAASEPLSRVMLGVLPPRGWLVVPVPTAPPRVRQRGYDQSVLLARQIAAKRGLKLSPALARLQNSRQVGATRVQRAKQSAKMFFIAKNANVQGAHILLVDDVCTTGATLSAAARLLKAAGAVQVDAVVAAWQGREG